MFWNDERNRQPIRVVALRATVGDIPLRVVAAETTSKRERASRDALVSAIKERLKSSVGAEIRA